MAGTFEGEGGLAMLQALKQQIDGLKGELANPDDLVGLMFVAAVKSTDPSTGEPATKMRQLIGSPNTEGVGRMFDALHESIGGQSPYLAVLLGLMAVIRAKKIIDSGVLQVQDNDNKATTDSAAIEGVESLLKSIMEKRNE